MITIWACLSSALKQIPSTHPYLESAREHLAIAVLLADKYTQTWHSIYWNGSKTSVKRRVTEELNNIAFDCFAYFMTASEYLNKYAALMDELCTPPAVWWYEANTSLGMAFELIHKENGHQIYCKQLRLSI